MDLSASFEDEMLAINPEYDLIFSKTDEKRLDASPRPWEERRRYSPRKINVISKMHDIIGHKPVGELPTQNDWDDTDSVERETIALMRKLGMEQSIDQAPDEKRTISTVPVTADVIYMRNGIRRMPIIMGDSHFKLKPRSEPLFDMDEERISADDSTTSELSDMVNWYEPLGLNTTNETTTTTLSDDEDSVEDQLEKMEQWPELPKKKDTKGSGRSSVESNWRRGSPRSEASGNSGRRSSNSSTKSSNSTWWRSNDTEARDPNNWRISANKSKEQVEKPVSKELPKAEAEVPEPIPEPQPVAVSKCGTALYKPKDLFIKKRAMLISQVLAQHQS